MLGATSSVLRNRRLRRVLCFNFQNAVKVVIIVLLILAVSWLGMLSVVDKDSASLEDLEFALEEEKPRELLDVNYDINIERKKKELERKRRTASDQDESSARSAHRQQLLHMPTEDKKQHVTIDRSLFNYLTSELRNAKYPGVEIYTQYSTARLGLKPLSRIPSLRPDFGPVLNDVTGFQYPLTVSSCKKSGSAPRSLFIVINSAPAYFTKRDTIRKTWARHLKSYSKLVDIGMAFIVGKDQSVKSTEVQKRLKEESIQHKDIIQLDMLDSYYNITLKVTGLLNWLDRECSDVDFVLKLDDDVYLNVRNLATTLQTLRPSSVGIYGVSHPFLSVVRHDTLDDSKKWAISYEAWPWIEYPTFIRGAAVLMASKAIRPLLAAFQTTPFIPFDDVYLTGLAAKKAGVPLFDMEWMFELPTMPLDECFAHDSISWLTSSGKEMEESHVATEQFYNNERKCINVIRSGTNGKNNKHIIASPNDVVPFPFKPIK